MNKIIDKFLVKPINLERIKMRINYIHIIALSIVLSTSMTFAQNYKELFKGEVIDLSKCNFTIEEVKVVEEIETDSETIEADEWGFKLVEVKIRGKAPYDGVLIYNQAIFSFLYRTSENNPSISLSKGVGQKFTSKDGEKKQIWAVWDDMKGINVSMVFSKDEEIDLYTAFELPKDVNDFTLMAPAITIAKGHIAK